MTTALFLFISANVDLTFSFLYQRSFHTFMQCRFFLCHLRALWCIHSISVVLFFPFMIVPNWLFSSHEFYIASASRCLGNALDRIQREFNQNFRLFFLICLPWRPSTWVIPSNQLSDDHIWSAQPFIHCWSMLLNHYPAIGSTNYTAKHISKGKFTYIFEYICFKVKEMLL